ncbi:hypothetical protein EZI54_06950 [Marinobacter halodurans]|uniref:DUF485 domain-containing protein n=1 Tax=Marinobacter halodurans TaxID=2528979 RepID=A0ABY1ZM36_9GAMM|nr:hypothetical protein [Marinobacter halodurans]TBW57389.1 hypothetical protein EZI54_06950 [Marinobacter halodurans]
MSKFPENPQRDAAIYKAASRVAFRFSAAVSVVAAFLFLISMLFQSQPATIDLPLALLGTALIVSWTFAVTAALWGHYYNVKAQKNVASVLEGSHARH